MSKKSLSETSWQLATEILAQIFDNLSVKDLLAARQVCGQWRDVADYMYNDENMWLRHCKQDFNSLYKLAKKNSNDCLLWFDIYQSLKLWDRVSDATEIIGLFCEYTMRSLDIKNLVILKNGVVSVHTNIAVLYYDISTKKRIDRDPVYGDFLSFVEFDNVIVILDSDWNLRIIKRAIRGRESVVKSDSSNDGEIEQDNERVFFGIKYVLNINRNIYYMNFDDEIFQFNLDHDLVATELPHNFEEDIMRLSIYNDQLYALLTNSNLYVYENNKFKHLFSLAYKKRKIFHYLWKYQFIETIDWKWFNIWATASKLYLPEPLKYISKVRVYGDMIFIGCKTAKLYMYYKPFVNGYFNLHKHSPIRTFEFMDSELLAVYTGSSIINVDVMEIKGGHKILVALPRKVMIITYIHNNDKPKTENGVRCVCNRKKAECVFENA